MSKSEDNPDMRVLKTATCKTLSGKSTLTYQIGAMPDSTVHLRISKNSGKGYFSNEWIEYEGIRFGDGTVNAYLFPQFHPLLFGIHQQTVIDPFPCPGLNAADGVL